MHILGHVLVSSEEDRPQSIRVTVGMLTALVALLLLILMHAISRKSDRSRSHSTCCHTHDSLLNLISYRIGFITFRLCTQSASALALVYCVYVSGLVF